MSKPKTSIKTFLLCSLLGGFIGFFIGGGWEIFFKFDEWRYETFYRSENLELLHLAVWFLFKPGLATASGLVLGTVIPLFLKSQASQKQS